MRFPPYIRGLIDLFSTGKRVGVTLGTLGLAIALISVSSSYYSHLNNPNYYGPAITGNSWLYIGIAAIILGFFAFIGDVRYSVIRQREQEIAGGERLRSAEDKLAKSLEKSSSREGVNEESTALNRHPADDALALSVLWELTNARLAQYHSIATRQASRSFATAQSAIVFGFLVLVGFAILSFRTHSATTSITTAVLGAVAAALAGYISRTFVRSQEASARHLRAYFDQPLEFSRYLAAERLLSGQSDTKPENRDAMLRIIIKAMVENPGTDAKLETYLSEGNSLHSMLNFLATRDQAGVATSDRG